MIKAVNIAWKALRSVTRSSIHSLSHFPDLIPFPYKKNFYFSPRRNQLILKKKELLIPQAIFLNSEEITTILLITGYITNKNALTL